jgi:hypothetical protein
MILTWAKQQSGGSIYAPAWYVMCAAGLALLAIPRLGRASAGRRQLDPMPLNLTAAALTERGERT